MRPTGSGGGQAGRCGGEGALRQLLQVFCCWFEEMEEAGILSSKNCHARPPSHAQSPFPAPQRRDS